MNAGRHLQLLVAATVVWLGFWLAGLPDYYQQYSTRSLVVFEVLLLAPTWAAGYLSLRRRRAGSRTSRAVAICFYFTVPLFLYDLLYCALYLGHGLRFVIRYWYLTAYYFVPWALLVPTAVWLDVSERRRARTSENEDTRAALDSARASEARR